MSAALIQSFEDLLIAANARLTADIKAETNPDRLVNLLTLAYRARVPRGLNAPSFTRHPRTHRQHGEADNRLQAPAAPANPPSESSTPPSPPASKTPLLNPAAEIPSSAAQTPALTPSPEPDAELDDPFDPNDPIPFYAVPLTDDEMEKLVSQIGFIDANRRRVARYQVALDYQTRRANAKVRRKTNADSS